MCNGVTFFQSTFTGNAVTILLLRYFCVNFNTVSLHFILRSSIAIVARCQIGQGLSLHRGYHSNSHTFVYYEMLRQKTIVIGPLE